MNKRFCVSVYLMVCFFTWLSAVGYAKVKWEKIEESELKKTVYEKAPEASAVILFDRGKIDIGIISGTDEINVVHQKYRRIKI